MALSDNRDLRISRQQILAFLTNQTTKMKPNELIFYLLREPNPANSNTKNVHTSTKLGVNQHILYDSGVFLMELRIERSTLSHHTLYSRSRFIHQYDMSSLGAVVFVPCITPE